MSLHNRLGVSRAILRATLDDLIAEGWVQRNPGYGHPMRPEYLLTGAGRQLAPSSGRLLGTVRRLDIEPMAFRKWTMPVMWVLGSEPRRFGELRHELSIITPRALTLSLKDMEGGGLVHREVFEEYPPVTSYSLQRRARPIYRALSPMAETV